SKLASCQRKGRMTDPLAKKRKGSNTITMSFDGRDFCEGEVRVSPVHNIKGVAWRLQLTRYPGPPSFYGAVVHCDGEGELWRCDTKITLRHKVISGRYQQHNAVSHTFCSWNPDGSRCDLSQTSPIAFSSGEVAVDIEVVDRRERFSPRPNIDLIKSSDDVVLVLEGKKVTVNKQVLADQSTYFMGLFFSDFRESKQEEIEIKETDPQDFHELLKMLYGVSKEPTTVENAIRFLVMADKFDLNIVKDRVENFLLSTNLISIHRKCLIAEEHKLETLRSEIFPMYKQKKHLLSLWKSPEFAKFPPHFVKNTLFNYACQLLQPSIELI
ncbi:hypothetical protein PENTCL1PPCAC_14123, partial [Pristionchus entomophagus]